MADLDKIAKALRLFDEKANKLERLSFLAKLEHPDSGVSISFDRVEEGKFQVQQERRGPDEEATDAFVLTFRFFVQNNEQSSFHNMEKHYLNAPVDPALQQKFVELRKQVNDYLDEYININYNGEPLTRRRVMDVFLYGGLSHGMDEEKRRLYLTWMQDPIMSGVIENEFMLILRAYFIAITMIRDMNKEALRHLPGPS